MGGGLKSQSYNTKGGKLEALSSDMGIGTGKYS